MASILSVFFAAGIGLNSVALIQLKIVLFAPIPRASVSTAVIAKPGARRNCRNAYRISASSCFIAVLLSSKNRPRLNLGKTDDRDKSQLFGSQRFHGLDGGGAPCRRESGDKNCQHQHQRGGDKADGIERSHAEQQQAQEPVSEERAHAADQQ